MDAQSSAEGCRCNQPRGFWSSERLRERLAKGLVRPYSPGQVEFASYLLRVGDEAYVTPSGLSEARDRTRRILGPRETIEIPSGQMALLITNETVEIPADAIAFIAMRSKTKFRGLINVSGFHVDPGYTGKLIFAVFNAGPAAVHVSRGDPLFVIFFADLDRRDESGKRDAGRDMYQNIPAGLINPISDEFLTLKGLDSRIDDLKAKLDDRLKSVERDSAVI